MWATNFEKKPKIEEFTENYLIIAKMVKGIITKYPGQIYMHKKKLSFTIFDLYPLHPPNNVQVNVMGIFLICKNWLKYL
jgi:hypothetical protein